MRIKDLDYKIYELCRLTKDILVITADGYKKCTREKIIKDLDLVWSDEDYLEGLTFVNCTFIDSSIEYVNCEFINCTLRDQVSTNFYSCKFENVEFIGNLIVGVSKFIGCDFNNVSFKNLIINHMEFDYANFNNSDRLFEECAFDIIVIRKSYIDTSTFNSLKTNLNPRNEPPLGVENSYDYSQIYLDYCLIENINIARNEKPQYMQFTECLDSKEVVCDLDVD